MSKDGSAKTDAMRKMREDQWAAQQRKPRVDPTRTTFNEGRDDDTEIGTLRNEPSTPALPAPAAKPAAPPKPSRGAKAPSAPRAPAAAASSSSAVAEGTCPGCGKTRALRNGKVVSHQKGLGKPCPGVGKAAS